jgi:hypothetical protein
VAFVLPNKAKSGILTQQANMMELQSHSDTADLASPENAERGEIASD